MSLFRIICVAMFLVLGFAAVLWGAEQGSARQPNIVVILADDLGFKDVGYHGSEIKTPKIDRLAAGGVQLNRFYVQQVCSPTRASLMTGRYPIRHGLQVGVIRPWNAYGLPTEERTLPAALKQVGYRTVMTGKWHLGCLQEKYLPTRRGFDHHYGHYLGALDYFTHLRDGGLDWHRNEQPIREEGYTTNLIGDEAVRLIKEHDEAKPLFCYVAFNAPHTPLQAPQEYIDRYAHIKNARRQKYAAMVACMDEAVGRIISALEQKGMATNTLVLFCSDNGGPLRGGACNDPLREGKGTLYEGGVRVPAVAYWLGRLKGGEVVDETMHIVDWYATVLKLAGASLDQPRALDGVDVWPAIAEGKPSGRIEVLHNVEPTRGALRRGDYKLIWYAKGNTAAMPGDSGGKLELYNVVADPRELKDLAQSQPQKARELVGRLRTYAEQALEPNISSEKPSADFKTPEVWGPLLSGK